MHLIKAFAAIAMFLFSAAQSAHAASSKIGVLVFDGFLTSDVTVPIEVFGAATKKAWFSSYKVTVISTTKEKKVVSEEGLTIFADATIYDNLDLDVLIVPSSYNMGPLVGNADIVNFIKEQARKVKWMASNCSGAFLLGEAGVLDGKKATTWAGGEKGLQKAYPKALVQFDQNYVVDDKLITSNGGPISYQAAFALLEKLAGESSTNEVKEALQFARLKSAFTQ